METEFRDLVITASGLARSRVNWGEEPTETVGPYITMHLISWNSGHTQQGPDFLNTSRVQVDLFGQTFGVVRELAGTIRDAIDGYRGSPFRAIFTDGMRLTREASADAGEAIYRASLDFIAHWREAENG